MSYEEFEGENIENILDQYENYDSYLDSFISNKDIEYLGNVDIARQLIELGLNIKTQILSKEEFTKQKQALFNLRKNQFEKKIIQPAFLKVDKALYEDEPFLLEISKREEDILQGKLQTIVFLRAEVKSANSKAMEVSAYIDLGHRLRNDKFQHYYERKAILLPKTSDLSYFNWNTEKCVFNDSKIFSCESDIENKQLIFKNKRDRKNIYVDREKQDENTIRTDLVSNIPEYLQIVFFDQYFNKKARE